MSANKQTLLSTIQMELFPNAHKIAQMDLDAEISRQFFESITRSDLVDITKEISLLREVKDILDELNILS